MKSVLVTGANGHVGYNLVCLLVERGYQVRASVRNLKDPEKTKPLSELGVKLVEADIMKPETLPKAVEGMDGVFQVAAVYQTWAKDPQKEIIDPSIIGGINVLNAAKNAEVKKVVFTSSVAAVGTDAPKDRPFTESDWNEGALGPYMVAKTQAEKRAWEFSKQHGLKLVTINPSAVIGPGFYRHTPSTQIFEMALRGQLPVLPPFAFSYVDVRDVAKAHLLAYEKENASGRYIIADETFSMRELMKELKDIDPKIFVSPFVIPIPVLKILSILEGLAGKWLNRTPQLTPDVVEEFAGKHPYFSSQKARSELGWSPMPMRQSLSDTLHWIRNTLMR